MVLVGRSLHLTRFALLLRLPDSVDVVRSQVLNFEALLHQVDGTLGAVYQKFVIVGLLYDFVLGLDLNKE